MYLYEINYSYTRGEDNFSNTANIIANNFNSAIDTLKQSEPDITITDINESKRREDVIIDYIEKR